MKTNYIFQTLVMLFFVFTATAQQGINYKAIINDSNGDALANTTVTVQFTILENGTTEVYKESHSPTTDVNGILIVNIGEGTLISGDYNTIDWGSNPHFLKTEIDSGDGLTDMGTIEFKTVPYALYAKDGSGAKELNDLNDSKFDGSSLFVGQGAGNNDDGSNDNTAIGNRALYSNTDGYRNTATGFEALYHNITGIANTANGVHALRYNTLGNDNTASGYESLLYNTTGNRNTATGYRALCTNNGGNNTANGYLALSSNSSGNNNTAYGMDALFSNTTGINNTATGFWALYYNTIGIQNMANGVAALYNNTTGNNNTANGYRALNSNTVGYENTATGSYALNSNTGGTRNTAYGYRALYNLTAGDNNIGIGDQAQVPNSTGSNQIRMGNSSITYAGIQVAWTVTSDERWKEDIRNLPYGLDMLMKLKPVDYIRKNNEKLTREMGIIAQDLEEVLNEMGYEDQGFLIKDDDGYLQLRYNDLIALLTKAVQDQQEIIEDQKNEIKFIASELEENREEQQTLDKRLTQLEEILNTAQL